MAAETSLREVSERLDAVLKRLEATADPAAKVYAREAVELLMRIQGDALARVLELAADPALGGAPLVTRLADDPLVGPLLTVHGAHPHPPQVRVERLLDRLRPRIAASGCRVAVGRHRRRRWSGCSWPAGRG